MLVYAALSRREVTRMQLLCVPLGLAVSIGVMTRNALWFLLVFVLVDLASSFGEFSLLRQMLKARERTGLSQAQIASRMGTKAPAVTRLESSLSSGKHSPSVATLRRYAHAVGCELEVNLVKPRHAKP